MFKIGQTVICVDEKPSCLLQCGMKMSLQHLKEYIVYDYSDCFVILQGVKGEWHETRFVAAEVVC